jgi:hypothetical protein
MTSNSNPCMRVTCVPSSRDAKHMSVPRSLGRAGSTGPAVVLTVRWPARSRPPRRNGRGRELGDLGLQRGLQDQPGAQPDDVFQDLSKGPVFGEQGVDVSADAVGSVEQRARVERGRR